MVLSYVVNCTLRSAYIRDVKHTARGPDSAHEGFESGPRHVSRKTEGGGILFLFSQSKLKLFCSPSTVTPSEVPEDMQMEIIELQYDFNLRETCSSVCVDIFDVSISWLAETERPSSKVMIHARCHLPLLGNILLNEHKQKQTAPKIVKQMFERHFETCCLTGYYHVILLSWSKIKGVKFQFQNNIIALDYRRDVHCLWWYETVC